jgi:hypothetical protein
MANEHLITDVETYRLEPCKIVSVTFLNSAADAQGVNIVRGRLASTSAEITLKGAPGLSSQFTFGGLEFPDGFTVFPTAGTVTDIIIEYEDIGQ